MSTGGDLVGLVQLWLSGEKEIKLLQSQIRDLRKKQKSATENLVSVMKTHDIDCLDVKDGRLSHRSQVTRGSVSKKHLLESISTFFQDYDDPELSSKLTGHIMNSRKTTVRDKLNLRKGNK